MARVPKTHCPSCNSLQRFMPKHRVVEGFSESYITCGMCRHEIVVSRTIVDQVPLVRTRDRRRNAVIRGWNR